MICKLVHTSNEIYESPLRIIWELVFYVVWETIRILVVQFMCSLSYWLSLLTAVNHGLLCQPGSIQIQTNLSPDSIHRSDHFCHFWDFLHNRNKFLFHISFDSVRFSTSWPYKLKSYGQKFTFYQKNIL